MSRASHDRVSRLFTAACEMAPPARSAYLDRECGADAALRAEVEALLALDAPRLDAFAEDGLAVGARLIVATAGATGDAANAPPAEAAPAQIGRYRIVRLIGAGGMGTVYEAEQESPRRRVAVKIIRTEMMTPSTVRRFAHEAELLGRLHHPGIAQVHEAGTARMPQGDRPYYAMELIEGKSLAEHARVLPKRGRLELIAKICDAVEFAHAHGVVHRDLKPANILVDGLGQPKVLDFGVARLVGGEGGEGGVQATTQHTVAGQLIGTVPYMSPEQVAGDPDLVGVRSDVYALGVMLYEVLSSRLPLDLARKPLPEAAWIIREQEPSRLGSLDTSLRGDVETIAAKALEKDPARRYPGAGALAEDIRRFLRDEPITARPPTTGYQLRKFAKRNPGLVIGVCAALIALSAGVVATSIALARAVRARADAETAAARARAITTALERTLSVAGPLSADHEGVTVREMLDKAENDIRSELAAYPESEIEVRTTLARTDLALGAREEAERNLRRALEVATNRFGPHSPEAIACTALLADEIADSFDLDDWDAIDPFKVDMAFPALDDARRLLGPGDPVTLSLMDTCSRARMWANDPRGAAEILTPLVAHLPLGPGAPDPVSSLAARSRLWWCLEALGERDRVPRLRAECLALADDPSGETASEAAQSPHRWLANLLMDLNDAPGAERVLRRGLAAQERLLGRWHAQTCRTRELFVASLNQQGKFADLLELTREVLDHIRKENTNKTDIVWWEQAAADQYRALGEHEKARALAHDACSILRDRHGLTDPRTVGYGVDYLLRCGLGVQDHWAGDGVRQHVRQVLADWLRDRRVPFTAEIRWDRLEFSLVRWTGRSGGGPGFEAGPHGGEQALRELPDPAPGLYRLTVDVPIDPTVEQPLAQIHTESWLLSAAWVMRMTRGLTEAQARERAVAAESAGVPDELCDEERRASVIAFENFWDLGFGPRNRNYNYGILATARLELPPGSYRFVLRADDNASLWIDGAQTINGWSAPHGSTLSEEKVDLAPGPHQLRVAYAQGGKRALLWLSAEPLDAARPSEPGAPNSGVGRGDAPRPVAGADLTR